MGTASRAAFDLGRAENEFRWWIVNVIVGGIDGTASLAVLDQVGVALEVVAPGRQSCFRVEFEELRGDWVDYLAIEGDWRRRYGEALEVNTEDANPALSPTERVLNHLWSSVDQYHRDLEAAVQLGLFFAPEGVKTAYSLGRVLDQGVRPSIALVDADVASGLGYTFPARVFRVPSLRSFVREVPDPDHAARQKHRAKTSKRHGTKQLVEGPQPPAVIPAPNPHSPGDLPPASSWNGGLRVLWERLDLDCYRPLPESTANVATAAPATRVALVEHIAALAHEAFAELRQLARAGALAPPHPQSLDQLQRELAAKLTGCTSVEQVAFAQYQFAARRIAKESSGVKQPKDANAFAWLRDHANADERGTLPKSFDTWARYLRAARKKVGESKNRPRGGRSGRSLVRPEQIELTGDDAAD